MQLVINASGVYLEEGVSGTQRRKNLSFFKVVDYPVISYSEVVTPCATCFWRCGE